MSSQTTVNLYDLIATIADLTVTGKLWWRTLGIGVHHRRFIAWNPGETASFVIYSDHSLDPVTRFKIQAYSEHNGCFNDLVMDEPACGCFGVIAILVALIHQGHASI